MKAHKLMKIFLDTADTEAIKKGYETGLVDGITTNPSLIMKSGRDPEEVYQELADLGVLDISMEVVGTRKEMYTEGLRLAEKFGKDQTTIKVPCTPDGLPIIGKLSGIDNLILAVGHCREGLTLSASTGTMITSILKSGMNEIDPLLRPERFGL